MPLCNYGFSAAFNLESGFAILDKNNVVPTNTELRGTPENILVLGKAPLTSDTTIVR